MTGNKGIEALKGTWDFIDGDPMDEYLKAFGVNKIVRSMANLSKPRLIINESNGKWTIITDNGLRSNAIKFVPGNEYETTLTTDGREVKGVINFENDKWIELIYDEEGKQTIVTRWVDNNDQQNVILEVGDIKVNRRFKRVK